MIELQSDALIFDLDGVLVNSQAVVERQWRRWATAHDFDGDEVIRIAHGRRIVETIRRLVPTLDARKEARRLAAREAADTDGLKRVEGASDLIQKLPDERWAIATSGARDVATTRLRFAGLPIPAVFITAEDVAHGKPHPEVYECAARQLSIAPIRCLVIEDTPAGLEAAQAAGMQTVAVTTTHAAEALDHADAVTDALRNITLAVQDEALHLRVHPE